MLSRLYTMLQAANFVFAYRGGTRLASKESRSRPSDNLRPREAQDANETPSTG